MNGCHRAAGALGHTARGDRTRLMMPPDAYERTMIEVQTMIGKWLCRGLFGVATLVTPLSATMAEYYDCPIPIVLSDEPNPNYDIRDQCRGVYKDREEILIDLRRGKKGFSDYAEVASAFAYGAGKCKKRPDLALAMADAAIGSPVRAGSPTLFFLELASDDFPEARRREITVGQWLLHSTYRSGSCSRGYYADYLPFELSAEEIRPTLLTDHYWQVGIEQFGNNPGRDRLVMRELIDPRSPKFDLGLASYLAPQFKRASAHDDERREMAIEIAEALTVRGLGHQTMRWLPVRWIGITHIRMSV